MAKCPKCKTTELRHALLQGNLPGHSCHNCGGALLNLVTYRDWREFRAVKSNATPSIAAAAVAKDSTGLAHCSKCKGVMTKYRISSEIPNRVDYCAHCEDLWMDRGELEALEAVIRAGYLTKIVTQPWQEHVRNESTKHLEEDRMKRLLGPDYERLLEFSEWVKRSPNRDEIIAYLHRARR